MRVLVIGGAGYIGSHVVKALLKAGHTADVFDNFSSGLKENLFKESLVIEGDILDYPFLQKSMAGYDAVIHLAAFKAVGESMVYPEKYSLNNITGSLNILNAMTYNNIKNIVFSSSAAIFGDVSYLPIDEDHPKNPTSYYGFTKLKIEEFMDWYRDLKGLQFASLRYFNACGYDIDGEITGLERNPANLLPIIMEVAVGKRAKLEIFGDDYPTTDGTCIRDYIHVSDLAEAHVKALEYINTNSTSVKLNLGTGKGLSVLEIYNATKAITGREIAMKLAPRRAGDSDNLVAGCSLANKLLNWQAKYSDVNTLIKTTYDAYLKHYSK